jgi:dephospho-CoA kinase
MRIGFLGKMGSGKTTAAKLLYTAMGYEKVSLAGPLKEIAKLREEGAEGISLLNALYGYAFELLPDPIYQAANFTYTHPRTGEPITTTPIEMLVQLWLEDLQQAQNMRELYQRIGTDSGRFIKPAIWIDHFARNLKDGPSVVDDVRFVNEGWALGKLGFLKIKIAVPEELRQERLIARDGKFEESRQDHPSETELDQIIPDVVIHNISDTKYLYTCIQKILHKFSYNEYHIGQDTVQYAPVPDLPKVTA